MTLFFIFNFLEIHLCFLERQIYRGEKEKKIHLLVYSPSGCHGQSQEATSIFRVSQVSTGSQGFGPTSTDFPGRKWGVRWEIEQLGHVPVPLWDPGRRKARIYPLAIVLGLFIWFYTTPSIVPKLKLSWFSFQNHCHHQKKFKKRAMSTVSVQWNTQNTAYLNIFSS